MVANGDGAAAILVTVARGVAWITLNRPEKRNAITSAMREQLASAFAALDADESVRVAVLTGAGSAFCAGVDLSDGTGQPHPLEAAPLSAPLDRFAKPIVAALNGPAVGGGLELALAADVRIASSAATLALPEVRLGSLPGSGGTQRLPRLAPAVGARMLLTGDAVDAAEALRCGILSDVVEPDQLLPKAELIAARIAANAPLSVRAAKLALRAARDESAGLALERALWSALAATEDRAEGRSAFREKREPRYTGS